MTNFYKKKDKRGTLVLHLGITKKEFNIKEIIFVK
jgi:hypothetical protein